MSSKGSSQRDLIYPGDVLSVEKIKTGVSVRLMKTGTIKEKGNNQGREKTFLKTEYNDSQICIN